MNRSIPFFVLTGSFVAGLVLALVVALQSGAGCPCSSQQDHSLFVNSYEGTMSTTIGGCKVEIHESDYGCGFGAIVHLYPSKVSGERRTYEGITGHIFCNSEDPYRIFYCGMRLGSAGQLICDSSGCNSMEREGTGEKWTWHPCSGDDGKVPQLTQTEIDLAQDLLAQAFEEIHNPQHFVSGYRWNEVNRQLDKVTKEEGPVGTNCSRSSG